MNSDALDKILGLNVGKVGKKEYGNSWENKVGKEVLEAQKNLLLYLNQILSSDFNNDLFSRFKTVRIKPMLKILVKNGIKVTKIEELIFDNKFKIENISEAIELTKKIAGN